MLSPVFITRGGYIYTPSLNDYGDKNDKEFEKSPMRVIGRGLWKPCHCCHSCHGSGRAALCITALPLVYSLTNREGEIVITA